MSITRPRLKLKDSLLESIVMFSAASSLKLNCGPYCAPAFIANGDLPKGILTYKPGANI